MPFESDWYRFDGYEYASFAVPGGLPAFVPNRLNNHPINSIAAAIVYDIVDHPPYAARVYRRKKVWYNPKFQLHREEMFPTIDEATQRAHEWEHDLTCGRLPEAQAG